MKFFFYLIVFLLLHVSVKAQLKIGKNPGMLNENAELEVESLNKGFLLPRMALQATHLPSPLNEHVAGMTIYNTHTSGEGEFAVFPGMYYSDGTKWVRINVITDGSETKLTAGSNVSILGTGTASSPYTISFNPNQTNISSTSPLPVSGDLFGTTDAARVIGLQGYSVSTQEPVLGQLLQWSQNGWTPTTFNTVNLYTTDGILTENRIITQNDKSIAFSSSAIIGTSHFTIDGTTLNIDAVNNRVGIGTSTPTERLEVNGNIRVNSIIVNSDFNLKKTILPVKNSLDNLSKLNAYTYYFKKDTQSVDLQFGLIAQEVQHVYPNLVTSGGEYLGVNYVQLIPILIDAIKELKAEIDTLKKQIKK